MKFIAITGNTGSGKTDYSNAIAALLNCKVVTFGNAVKAGLSKIIGNDESLLMSGNIKNEKRFACDDKLESARELLETFANAMKRLHGKGVFAKQVLDAIEYDQDEDDDDEYDKSVYVVSDLRFKEEFAMLTYSTESYNKVTVMKCGEPTDYDCAEILAEAQDKGCNIIELPEYRTYSELIVNAVLAIEEWRQRR